MFALASRLFPTTLFFVGLAIGALPAAGAGWLARGLAFDWFERPALEQTWTLELEREAVKARADEQLRQFEAGELATEQFIQSTDLANADRQAELDMLQLEIERYEATRAESDHRCSIDHTDLEFLGVRQGAALSQSGSR